MSLSDNLEYIFNSELAKRLLIRYFSTKGFHENFDKKVYPPQIQDLVESVPELNGKLEIIPHAIEVDPTNGFARIGWNLFILGNQRMYLGETEHSQLQELAQQLESGMVVVEGEEEQAMRQGRSARDIIGWIVRVLGKNEAGIIRMIPQADQMGFQHLGPQGTDFYERPRTIRPETKFN